MLSIVSGSKAARLKVGVTIETFGGCGIGIGVLSCLRSSCSQVRRHIKFR